MVNGFVPKDLREALELRAAENVVPYAGGTDLMVENRPGVSYLFIGKLAELRQIREDERCIRIGAAVTYTEALASPLVPPLMKEAVSRIAAPAIRNAGTFGGNLGNGSAKNSFRTQRYGLFPCAASELWMWTNFISGAKSSIWRRMS